MTPLNYSITYILWSDGFRKLACLFAGLGHLQPLLLATTNSHYLLDRFCMERCCSGEYVSRIVTSIIFMEILAIIVVRIVLYMVLKDCSDPGAENLVEDNKTEEWYRDIISITILWAIFLGYIQIFYAFTTGGKKGHMHWFYVSLMLQHFLNSLIAGSIGFWEVGRALWYLATLPMATIVIFFYQMIMHSWIRNNGPRDVEYIVVENQIWLAICLSSIATIFWTAGYATPHIPPISPKTKAPINNLTTTAINHVTMDSITLKYENSGNKTITLSGSSSQHVTVTAKVTSQDKVTITATVDSEYSGTITVYNRTLEVTVSDTQSLTLQSDGNAGTINVQTGTPTETATATNETVIVKFNEGVTPTVNLPTSATYIYKTFYPNRGHYISSVEGASVWNEEWDGGRCFYAEYYKNDANNGPALLKLYILGNTLTTKYYGKASGGQWKIINSSVFYTKLDELQRTGEFTISGGENAEDPSYNTNFNMVLFDPENLTGDFWGWYLRKWKTLTPTWFPLLMQGLSVGAVGSIFPNLIPKTLTSAKTTRTLSVMNMFLVTVPHIFNVMLGDMDLLEWIGVGAPWEGGFHTVWLLYIIYILAILFAIFNIHYPEWRLSCFLRNNTWFVFLMILFTDVLNETFNAISRAGICSQKAAGGTKKNHPCLHNKIACLMNLTYIPFWMTTTPMMKS